MTVLRRENMCDPSPGESRAANIGISLPGNGETPRAPVFIDGEHRTFLQGDSIVEEFIEMVDRYVDEK